MLGVQLAGEAAALSFTLTPRGGAPRTLQPTGWLSDATGRVALRAPAALCALLWPRLTPPLLACWQPHAADAMRALALHLAAALDAPPPPPAHQPPPSAPGHPPEGARGGAHAQAAALLSVRARVRVRVRVRVRIRVWVRVRVRLRLRIS